MYMNQMNALVVTTPAPVKAVRTFTNGKLVAIGNKEKLEEIAIMTVNVECSVIIMNKVPEKLEDPGKFLIPCALQELNRTSVLASRKRMNFGSTTTHSDDHSSSSSPVKTSDNVEKFADELVLLDSLPPAKFNDRVVPYISYPRLKINEPTQEEIDILLVPVNYSTVVVDADSKI
ncbi:hypothetical protein Tco_1254700 [Tanacetum coccineum]